MIERKIIVTTTRRSNPRIRSLAKEIALALPAAIKVNRGKMNYLDIFRYAKSFNADRIIVICRGLKGNPGKIVFLDVTGSKLKLYPLILKLKGIKLAREAGIVIERPSSIIINARAESEILDFGMELAGALALSFIENAELYELSTLAESALVIEASESLKNFFILKFVDTRTGNLRGPRLVVEKV
ncbi:MAG: hypothetical protein QXY49_06380 [Thermofilaceae archaeon]